MRRGDILTRLDADYYLNSPVKRDFAFSVVPLASICTDVFQGVSRNLVEQSEIKLLKVKNILGVDGIDFEDVEFVAAAPRSKILQAGDILSPFIGQAVRGLKFSLFPKMAEQFAVDNNCGVIRPSTDKVLPLYLLNALRSKFCSEQILQLIGGGGVPFLGAANAKTIKIPLPPLDIQRALAEEMEAARESRRAKLTQADELLKSIDGWLLAQLGVTVPPQSEHKVFAARLGEAKGRVDVAFHSPRFRAIRENIEHGKYPARTVGSFCISIKSGFPAGKQDQAENEVDGVPHLRPLNLSIYGDLSLKGTKYVPRTSLAANDLCQQGEVLFNNTNSQELVGKSTVFDLDVDCACSNHMTRLELTPDASPYFIAALFNALRSTGYIGMLATNFVNQAGVNADTLAALRVPFPTLGIQQTILSEVSRRRAEARRLRAEAEAEWQAAKERFEQQLLSGGTA